MVYGNYHSFGKRNLQPITACIREGAKTGRKAGRLWLLGVGRLNVKASVLSVSLNYLLKYSCKYPITTALQGTLRCRVRWLCQLYRG